MRTVTPQAAPPPARLATIDLNPTTVEGGTSSAGTVVTDVSATDGAVMSLSSSNPAVASVPPTTTVPPNGFAGTFEVTTSAVSVDDDGDDHGYVQRRQPFGHADDHAGGGRCDVEQRDDQPVERGGWQQHLGVRLPVGRGACRWSSGGAVEQRPCGRQPAVERDGRRRLDGVGIHRRDDDRIDDAIGDDLGDLQRHHSNGCTDRHCCRAATSATAERHRDGIGDRPQRRDGRIDSRRRQRGKRHQRIGSVRGRHLGDAARVEWPRRDLVGSLLQRWQQDEDVHLHRQRQRIGDGQHPVTA